MSTLYYYWTVQHVKVEFDVANEETFDVIVSLAPTDLRIKTNITSSSTALQVGELPYGKSIILGRNSGQNRGKMTISLNNANFLGNRNIYNGDLSYQGTQAIARPTSKQYITFSASSLGGTLTNGIAITMKITYKVKWSIRVFADDILRRNEDESEDNGQTILRKAGESRTVDKIVDLQQQIEAFSLTLRKLTESTT
jgi:hypothetical protein